MGISTAIGLGAGAIVAVIAYFYLRPPDLGAAKEAVDQATHDNIVRPFFDIFGYETTLDGDIVRYKPKGPHTLIFDKTVDNKDGSKTTFKSGTTFYPNGRIVAPRGGPTGGTPDHLREAAIRRRRELGLGPGPHGGN